MFNALRIAALLLAVTCIVACEGDDKGGGADESGQASGTPVQPSGGGTETTSDRGPSTVPTIPTPSGDLSGASASLSYAPEKGGLYEITLHVVAPEGTRVNAFCQGGAIDEFVGPSGRLSKGFGGGYDKGTWVCGVTMRLYGDQRQFSLQITIP